MHDHTRLGVEDRAVIAALIVSCRILLYAEKIGNFYHSGLLQDLVSLIRNSSYTSLLAIYLDTGKIFCESFLEPRVDLSRDVAVHKLMRVFMEHHRPGILDGHIQHDEAAVLATLKQSRHLYRFSMPKRNHLTQFLAVPERHNLQRNRDIDVRLAHQRGKYPTHLLEARCDLAPTLLTCIGHNGKMR